MINLYLDSIQAVLPDNVNIKLVKENAYFTKSSSYTYDITLPLEGCAENLMIFKHINRHDVSKHQQTLQAKLVVDCKSLLNGTAVVKSISEKDVKIQLVAGNSEFNFFSKGDEFYIDKMNLGTVIPDMRFTSVSGAYSDPSYVKGRFYHALHNDTVLFYPVWDETNERVINDYNLVVVGDAFYKHKNAWSPQPKLSVIIKRIFEELGYTVNFNINTDLPIDNIYIANTDATNNADRDGIVGASEIPMHLNKSLPHWTVNEFIDQIELFFGVTTYVDENEKKVLLIQNGKITDVNRDIYLENVVDSNTTEFDNDDQEKDLGNGNIGYDSDYSNDAYKYIKIDGDIFDKIEIKKYSTYEDLKQSVGNYNAYEAQYVHEAEGRQYIFIDSEITGKGLFEINQFRNLYRSEKKDLDVELKIVPCSMRLHQLEVYQNAIDVNLKYKRPILIPSLQGQTTGTLAEDATVQQIIEGEVVDSYSPDKLNVFYWDGNYCEKEISGSKTTFPAGITDKTVADILTGSGEGDFSFRLDAPVGVKCWGNLIYRNALEVNKTAKEVKRFISKTVYSPNGVFVIKNKRFLCRQIQTNITASGIDELQEFTGYQLLE